MRINLPHSKADAETSYYYRGDNTLLNLTHCGLMTPYGDTDLGQQWLR